MTRILHILFSSFLLIAKCLSTTTEFLDNYETRTPPASGALSPVGIYNGKDYGNRFHVVDLKEGPLAAGGVIPHSGSNAADLAQSLVDSALGIPQSFYITTAPGTKSFSVQNWYYGCTVDDLEGVAQAAEACNITATGFKAGPSGSLILVAKQVFEFKPQTAVDVMNPLTLGTYLKSFQGLVNLTLTFEPAALIQVFFDDLNGTITT